MSPDDPLSPEILNAVLENTPRETLERQLSENNERLLTDDAYRQAVCLHEAGHIIYGYRIHMSSYEVHLPEILTTPDGRMFVSAAAILPLEQARCAPGDDFELCYARFHAAGGVVAEKLSTLNYWESVCAAGDFCLFVDFMRERVIEERVNPYWTQAVQDVRNDLRASETSTERGLLHRIEKMAGEVSDKLLTQAGAFTEDQGGRNMMKVKLSAGESAILTESGGEPSILVNFRSYCPADVIGSECPFLDEPRDWNDIERVRKWNSLVHEAVAARRSRLKK